MVIPADIMALAQSITTQISNGLTESSSLGFATEIIAEGLMPKWLPIETAPRDGTQFIGYGSYHYPDGKRPTGYILMVSYSGDDQWPWYDADGKSAPGVYSHWMPLPSPPAIRSGEQP